MNQLNLTRSFLALPTLMLLTACLPSSPNTAQTVSSLQAAPTATIAAQPATAPTIVYTDLSRAASTTNQIFLDKNCQPRSTLTLQTGGYQVIYQSKFQAAGQARLLTAARYQDGAVELCLSQPNFSRSSRLAVEKLQDVFIDAIGTTNRNAVFGVKVREGNGFRVPISEYRLNLSRPERPDLVLIGTSRSSDLKENQSEAVPPATTPPTIASKDTQADSQTLTNGEWTITIGKLNSWSGVNNTGNLTYHGCDSQGKCLNLTGGKASERSGQVSYGWQNGEYFYSVSSPVTTEASSAATATLVVRQGDRIILRATGLK